MWYPTHAETWADQPTSWAGRSIRDNNNCLGVAPRRVARGIFWQAALATPLLVVAQVTMHPAVDEDMVGTRWG